MGLGLDCVLLQICASTGEPKEAAKPSAMVIVVCMMMIYKENTTVERRTAVPTVTISLPDGFVESEVHVGVSGRSQHVLFTATAVVKCLII
jgi:hypothetical protein